MWSRGLFIIFCLFSWGCTEAQTELQSLGLRFAGLYTKQGKNRTDLLKIHVSTKDLKFELSCPPHHKEAWVSWDQGGTWSLLGPLSRSGGLCGVQTVLSLPSGQSGPTYPALLKTRGDSDDSESYPLTFIAPNFIPASLSVSIENGLALTNTMSVSLNVNARLEAGSFNDLTPAEVYVTSTAGCGSGGSWQAYASVIPEVTLALPNAQNFIYVKFRDEAGNESSCLSDDIQHDGTAPVGVTFSINSGALQTLTTSVNLDILALGDVTEMQINQSSDCSGPATWEPYQTNKAWTLAGPGTNHVSIRFRDGIGNLSSCLTDSIVYDTNPPALPSSLSFAPGTSSTDNENPVSIEVHGVIDGDTARLFSDASCSTEVGQAMASGGKATVAVSLGADGSYTFYANVIDPGNFVSACTTISLTYNLDTQGPTVTNVSSTLANGDYTSGTQIPIQVSFSDPVFVSGSGLALDFDFGGGITAFAPYSAGSGTSTLTFIYTVEPTHSDDDLDYATSSALTLGTATIKDSSGNDADPTLPSPGGANSLGANKALQINFAVSVLEVIPPVARTYWLGEQLEFIVRWSGPVTIAATPQLRIQLQAPASPIAVNYSAAASNPQESRFSINVGATHLDLDGVTLVDINGATINNGFGVPANRTLPTTSFPQIKVRGEARPLLNFTESSLVLSEAGGATASSLTLNATSSEAVTALFNKIAMKPLGAVGLDLASSSATISSGTTAQNLQLNPVDDALSNLSRLFVLRFASSENARMNTVNAQRYVLIRDNENASPATPSMVSVGNEHACVLLSTGKVQCFGSNTRGQLGDGTSQLRTTLSTPISSGATKIVTAGDANCALMSNQTLRCWGNGGSYQLGTGSTSNALSPVQISGLTQVVDVALGPINGCAIYLDASVRKLKCWGQNSSGTVGDGTTFPRLSPVPITTLSGVDSVSIGSNSACALLSGALWCWGSNGYGQVGTGVFGGNYVNPQPITTPVTFDKIFIQAFTSCGVTAAGAVHCWGNDSSGALGDGGGSANLNAPPATPINLGGGFALELSWSNTSSGTHCALKDNQSVVCWGFNSNDDGLTGLSTSTLLSPTASLATGFTQFQLGLFGGCGITNQNIVACLFNQNSSPQYLHIRNAFSLWEMSNTPALLGPPPRSMSVFQGTSCVDHGDGTASCQSLNSNASSSYIGDGSSGMRISPSKIAANDIQQIVGGAANACFIDSQNVLRCWGDASAGMNGDGLASDRPLPVYTMKDAVKVKNGGATSALSEESTYCAQKTDSSLWCWGENSFGQTGNGLTTDTMKPFKAFSQVTDFAVGVNFTCAITGGAIKCVGQNNFGQLGDGLGTPSLTPVEVLDIYGGTPVQIEAGDYFACARYQDGDVRCWGQNNSGQLGRGNTTNSLFPWRIPDLTAQDLSLGNNHACARLTNGDLKCWGLNTYGQVGAGTWALSNNYHHTPQTVALSGVTKVWATKNFSTCAIASGQLSCWGLNSGLLFPKLGFNVPIPLPGLSD